MLQILSAEQEAILHHKEGIPSHINYKDTRVALETLLYAAMGFLEQGEAVSIHCSAAKRERLLALVNSLGWSHFTGPRLHDEQIAHLRSIVKHGVKKQLSHTDYYNHLFVSDDAKVYYETLNQVVLDELKVYQLPQVLDKLNMDNSIPLSEADLDIISKAGFGNLRATIADLAQHYTPSFPLFENGEPLKKEVVASLDEHSIHAIREQLHDFLTQFKSIKARIEKVQADYVQQYKDSVNSSRRQEEKLLRESILTLSQGVFVPETKGTLWKKRKQSTDPLVKEVISMLAAQGLDLAIEETIERKEFISVLMLRLQERNDPPMDMSWLKHINLLNQQNSTWSSIYDEIEKTCQKLNASNLLKSTFAISTKSLLPQIALINQIVDTLNIAYHRLATQPDYYIYQTKVSLLDPLYKTILSQLKEFPTSQWVEILTQSYIRTMALQSEKKMSTSFRVENVVASKRRAIKERISNVSSTLASYQIHRLAELQKSSRSTYQVLINKKLPLELSHEDLQTIEESVRPIFPIQIVTEPLEDDLILKTTQGKEIRLSPIDPTVRKQHSLYLNHIDVSGPIGTLSHIEKIKAAKRLAKLMLALNANIQIYQMRHASVISLLPPSDVSLAGKILSENGAKEMHMDDVYLQLVESLIVPDRTQYLLIKDGLLNPRLSEYMVWQKDVLEKCAVAGIEICSLNTSEILTSGIDSSTSMLLRPIVTKSSSKVKKLAV